GPSSRVPARRELARGSPLPAGHPIGPGITRPAAPRSAGAGLRGAIETPTRRLVGRGMLVAPGAHRGGPVVAGGAAWHRLREGSAALAALALSGERGVPAGRCRGGQASPGRGRRCLVWGRPARGGGAGAGGRHGPRGIAEPSA